jgi:hypothetical protein
MLHDEGHLQLAYWPLHLSTANNDRHVYLYFDAASILLFEGCGWIRRRAKKTHITYLCDDALVRCSTSTKTNASGEAVSSLEILIE